MPQLKLENLALKWAFCDHFKRYLCYAKHYDVFLLIIAPYYMQCQQAS